MGSGGEMGDHLTLADFAERAYLDYAISVVKGRALPDLCDGLKPVQRRILYAMDRLGLRSDAKPVKSARVVGDVLGKFHPHGDQSAYDALVRLAQGFSVRYPLIDGQGNFGSRDGDGAAAMRYTEARLTPFARLLLDELDEGTVAFGPNYDGSMDEPLQLPARLPVVLLNGASGIAVGMATEIPPHNLGEVAEAARLLLDKPNTSLASVLSVLPGPDFPGGGQIISSPEDLESAYASGRGSLRLRARWVFEELARGQWQLVVTELPHGVSSQKVLEEIEELTNPKIKAGKKALSAEQTQTKQRILGLLESVRDESGKDAEVRLVFEPRSSKIDRGEFSRLLLAETSLETSYAMNLVVVDAQGKPRSISLLEMLQQWVGYRIETVRARSRHRLAQAERRIHILEGRALALLHIDEVIRVIRESDEPKPALVAQFGLSEVQAEDILEIRLRQLARLEAIKIETELAALRETAAGLRFLLESEPALRKAVAQEIKADAKAFGDPRRTLMQADARTTFEAPVIDEPVTVIVSVNGWVRSRQGHGHDASQFGFKTGDALYAAFECRTTDHVLMLSSTGRAYSTSVAGLPGGRGDGAPLTSMIELEAGSRLVHFYAGAGSSKALFASAGGIGFVAPLEAMVGRNRSGKAFMQLEPNDVPAIIQPLEEAASELALLSKKGRLLVVSLDDVKALATGGRGVALIGLDPKGDALVAARGIAKGQTLHVVGLSRSGKPTETALEPAVLKEARGVRARKGLELKLRHSMDGLLAL